MLFGLLVFGAIVAGVFAFVATYNRLVAAVEKATRAWSDLDTLLRQRHDEIPKLLEMCEPHFASERALMERLLDARSAVFAARQTRDADALADAETNLRAASKAFMARAVERQELTTSGAFALLRQRQATLDAELRAGRDRYNQAVRDYNAAIDGPVGRLVALIGAFRPLRALDFEVAAP